MPLPRIPQVEEAKYIYKVRHFKYPIDVVNHENALEVPHEARMTCGYCKKFAEPSHTVAHHESRTNQGTLF